MKYEAIFYLKIYILLKKIYDFFLVSFFFDLKNIYSNYKNEKDPIFVNSVEFGRPISAKCLKRLFTKINI